MKKKNLLLVGALMTAMLFTGCSSEISNDKITISKYKGLEVEKVEVTKVTDESVDTEIKYMLEQDAKTVKVKNRAAKLGDTVNIDYVGKKNGKAFEGGTDKGYNLELGSKTFIEGFEEGVVGHKVGETFDINLTFPKDYGVADLDGAKVVFTVKINSISKVNVPELTDEWVKENTEIAKTVDELKVVMKNDLEKYYLETAENEVATASWEALRENVTVNKYDEKELQKLVKEYQDMYKSEAEYYDMKFEEYLKQNYGMTKKEFNAEIDKLAKEYLLDLYAADLIIEKERLDVSEESLDKIYESFLSYYGFESVDELKKSMEEAGQMEILKSNARIAIAQKYVGSKSRQVPAKAEVKEEVTETAEECTDEHCTDEH